MKKIDIATDITEIQRLTWVYCEQLNANKLGNLEEMDKFRNNHLPRLSLNKEISNPKPPNKGKIRTRWIH